MHFRNIKVCVVFGQDFLDEVILFLKDYNILIYVIIKSYLLSCYCE